ncbi:hypothetical protein [Agriterribacter sp.]|uniref:hypothetical protein n=1 Tax=Agriterribacter sp. TaxID=2821509 RepID=UPI002C218DB1|nr:hypothetical protein [Agriterribacter sp.]HRP55286.1 hypothetical protein [Agriterribacter sp.]
MNTLKPISLALLFLLPFLSRSQNTLEPYVGYGIDLAGKLPLSQVNIGLQYPVIHKSAYQMVIGVRGSASPYKRTGTDVAYSAGPGLPLTITTSYEKRSYSVALTLGNRWRIISWADKNMISLFVNAGLIHYRIRVKHDDFDSDKYTILNPHISFKKQGTFLGAGTQYRRRINVGYLFFQADISSPPITESKNNRYYATPAILAINTGYIVEFKKRNR